jgi:hypothetical protein
VHSVRCFFSVFPCGGLTAKNFELFKLEDMGRKVTATRFQAITSVLQSQSDVLCT